MSTFTDAMHEYVQASNRWEEHGEGADALARAGEVLEREMRQMMREELARFTGYNQGREGG